MSDKNSFRTISWIASLSLLAAPIVLYFIHGNFSEFVDSGYEVFSTGDKEKIISWIRGFGSWGGLVIIAGMVVQMFMVVVNVVLLMLVSILVYGPVWGSMIAICGIIAASTIGFFIGRIFGEATVAKLIGHRNSQKMEKYVQKYGYWAVVIVRLSPWLSNDAISFVAGILRMNYWKFMGATLMGIIPLTILIAWLGEEWERLKQGLIWITAATVVGFLVYFIYKKFKSYKE